MAAGKSTWVRAVALFSLLVLIAAALVAPRRRAPTAARPGAHAPLRTSPEGFLLVDGHELLDRVKRTHSSGTVVSAWASWCGSCKEELPMLLRLKANLGDAIDLFLVSVDDPEGRKAASDMLRGFGAPSPHFAADGPLDVFKAALNPKWTGVLPASFLFDRTGMLRYFWAGTVYENEITPLLRRYLSGEHIDGESNFALAPGVTE